MNREELDLLELLTDDGLPLPILAAGLDPDAVSHLAELASALLAKGLIGVYGRPETADFLTREEGQGVLAELRNWSEESDAAWFVAVTRAGDERLEKKSFPD